jgi:hypothetical protein
VQVNQYRTARWTGAVTIEVKEVSAAGVSVAEVCHQLDVVVTIKKAIMRGAVLYAPGDVRVEERDDPGIVEPTDAITRLSATWPGAAMAAAHRRPPAPPCPSAGRRGEGGNGEVWVRCPPRARVSYPSVDRRRAQGQEA